eukprot:TRINITY_DN6650_c0_g2_i2.p1 TRINITY_DN6650_c0_g2~~TRINITY_DN6650_c0_g2_i2.p1  ORF type:complete len:190 (-),score=73.06 TRINITY_DN6650_c0_g2_i2:28-597(-)
MLQFIGYSINSILFQRGIYPPETFSREKKYGLSMMVTNDEQLKLYLSNVLSSMTDWMLQNLVQKVVIVITGVDSEEVLERWMFDIETDEGVKENRGETREKSQKEITSEIQAIIRQITASVTFLPLLDEACTFDVLIYADKEMEVPMKWEESDAKIIENSQQVKLRSFDTGVHRVDGMVSFRVDDDDEF